MARVNCGNIVKRENKKLTDPENTFLIFFIIDVFSGFLHLTYTLQGYILSQCNGKDYNFEKKVGRLYGKRENHSGTGRILLLLS